MFNALLRQANVELNAKNSMFRKTVNIYKQANM